MALRDPLVLEALRGVLETLRGQQPSMYGKVPCITSQYILPYFQYDMVGLSFL